MGEAGGVLRVENRRFGERVNFEGDNSFPAGVMSPSADRRICEISFGRKFRQFLMGDLGKSGVGIWVSGD